jgi:hypothetical protein
MCSFFLCSFFYSFFIALLRLNFTFIRMIFYGIQMIVHTNVNYIPFTQLSHKFSYIVAILIHNHFESPNICIKEEKEPSDVKIV